MQEKKKMRYPAMGRKGRKNCLVNGMTKLRMRPVATSIFIAGPGDWAMLRQKMPRMARKRYCAS